MKKEKAWGIMLVVFLLVAKTEEMQHSPHYPTTTRVLLIILSIAIAFEVVEKAHRVLRH